MGVNKKDPVSCVPIQHVPGNRPPPWMDTPTSVRSRCARSRLSPTLMVKHCTTGIRVMHSSYHVQTIRSTIVEYIIRYLIHSEDISDRKKEPFEKKHPSPSQARFTCPEYNEYRSAPCPNQSACDQRCAHLVSWAAGQARWNSVRDHLRTLLSDMCSYMIVMLWL